MSLVVWLPLTKDLRQQGLSNVTVTNNGATYSSTGGKLGGCYSFTNQNIVVPSTNFKSNFTNNQASLAAWVKVTTNHSAYAQAIVLGTQGTSWNNILFGIDINGSGYPIANASSGSAYTNLSFGTAIKDGMWHHIVYTYNAGTMTVYLDGVQKNTTTTSNTPAWASTINLYIGGNSGGEKFQNGDSMNDVRLYNHCLSPMEVKELAKGLVLHYPLNHGGFGQENLFTERYWSYGDGWNTKNLINSSTSTIKPIVNSDGSCTLTGGDAASSQCYCSNNGNMVTLEPNTTYTISVKITTNGPCNFRMWWYDYDNSGTRLTTVSTPSEMIPSGTTKLFTFTRTTVANTAKCYWELNLYGTASTSTCIMHANSLKLEKGSIATPWCPNSSDTLATTMGLNSTTEYDCSGFCNNGTRTGTFTWTSDTPKYSVSTTFDGTNYISTTTPGADILTLSCWVKTSKNKSTSQIMVADSTSQLCISFYSGTIITFYASSGYSTGSKCTLGSAYKENDWNHLVVVKTGTGTRKVYCNGIEQTATSNDYWSSSSTGFTVARRETSTPNAFYGELCDVRAYATALSADDVKSLYQNCATIDPDGTIRGQIRS